MARTIARLPQALRTRMLAALRTLEEEPRPVGCKKLASVGAGLYRIRVGDHRVIYEIRDRELVVLVVRVGHRREVYGTR